MANQSITIDNLSVAADVSQATKIVVDDQRGTFGFPIGGLSSMYAPASVVGDINSALDAINGETV